MNIGIMGAMPEEIESLEPHLQEIKIVQRGSRSYCTGKLYAHNVTLVFSRWGKVAAATTATALITEFKIDQLIFTGVAGAASPDLNIGDIVISEQLYQHDMDARPLYPQHEIPLTNTTCFKADKKLIQQALIATDGLLSTLIQTIPEAVLKAFDITSPKCMLGTIATGDCFVSDNKQLQALLNAKPETTAVEMEGASVAQVCHDYQVPFVVIRTISDKADHSASIDFPKFVRHIAKHYAEHIVLAMIRSLK